MPSKIGRRGRVVQYMTDKSRWPFFVMFLIGIAFYEEVLWEWFVYQKYLPEMDNGFARMLVPWLPKTKHWTGVWRAMVTSTLALPQITHYWLDAFIWKMRGQNPGLKEALFGKKKDPKPVAGNGHTAGTSTTTKELESQC